MSQRLQWGLLAGLGLLVAPWVLREAPALLVPALAFLVTYRAVRRRRRGFTAPRRQEPAWRRQVALRKEWWGYVIPWEGEPLTPGYVGITSRRPLRLPDGRMWCPRWDDEDHVEKMSTYALDYSRAWVAFLEGAESEEEAEEGWEHPLIRQYRRQGFQLVNKEPYD